VRTLRAALWIAIACGTATCGGGDGGNPGGPSPGDNPNQLTISAAGVVTPRELTVAIGSRVLFINNHSSGHNMTSDPHPEHDDCPAINQIGLLQPGQRRETGNLVTARTCGIHDHDEPDNANLRARIVVR
jgi:plastocyanin